MGSDQEDEGTPAPDFETWYAALFDEGAMPPYGQDDMEEAFEAGQRAGRAEAAREWLARIDVAGGRVVVSQQAAPPRWEMSYWRMGSDTEAIIETRLVEADSMEAAVERFRSENPDCHVQSVSTYAPATWILAHP